MPIIRTIDNAAIQELQCRERQPALPPLFSVLIPTYNQAQFLPFALDSLLAQTYPDWEAVIVNDGSTDDTWKILADYSQRDDRIRVFTQPNGGPAAALNTAIRHIRGDWICWLSSDDLFEPHKLALHARYIQEKPEFLFHFTHYYFRDDVTGNKTAPDPNLYQVLPRDEYRVARFLYSNYITGISVALHRTVLEPVGGFRQEITNAQDFDLWLRISAHYRFLFLDNRTCVTRIHPDQETQRDSCRGVLDSSRAIMDFLNHHDFNALFPDLNLMEPAVFLEAIEVVFNYLSVPGSFVNVGGGTGVLVERIKEWLSLNGTFAFRDKIKHKFYNMLSQAARTVPSAEIQRQIRSLANAFHVAGRFRPVDPITEIAIKAEHLMETGDYVSSYKIRQYLLVIQGRSAERRRVSKGTGSPLASIIVTTYNRPRMLAIALNSIMKQTLEEEFEVIVVNDGGVSVEEVIKSFNSSKIRLIEHTCNQGMAAARNTGILAARGKYVAYLDDDDIYLPHHLETLVKCLEEQGCTVVYSDACKVFQEDREGVYQTVRKETAYFEEYDKDKLLYTNFIPTLCVAHRRDCFDSVGLFDEYLTTQEDWDFWIRLSRKFHFQHIKNVTAEFSWRTDGTSMTSHRQADFYRNLEAIYNRYRNFANDREDILDKQKRNREHLHGVIHGLTVKRLRDIQEQLSRCTTEMKSSVARQAPRPDPHSEEGELPPPELIQEVKSLLENKHFEEASLALERILYNHPRRAEFHRLASRAHYQLKRMRSAVRRLQCAVNLEPHNPDFQLDLLDLWIDLGRWPEAVQAIDIYLTYFPANKQVDRALTTLNKVYEISLE